MSERTKIDRWVSRCNAMARELDDIAASIHPSVWPEAMKEMSEKFKKLAGSSAPEVPR